MFLNNAHRLLKRVFYIFGWNLFRTVFSVMWRRRIIGASHVPKKGPVILASNHLSNVDPPVIGSSLKREVNFIAKAELFKNPIMSMVIKLVNGFPVKRGRQDIKALKNALDILEKDGILLLFPEGHRNPHNRDLKPKPGVGMLASMSDAVVIPTAVLNTDQFLRFKKMVVVFGEPMRFNKNEDNQNTQKSDQYRLFTEHVMQSIRDIKKQYTNNV